MSTPAGRSRLAAWATGELDALRRLPLWPAVAVLAVVALGLALAYQRTRPQQVDVGGEPLLDYPFLFGAWESETSTTERVPFDYRWTHPEALISLPGLGSADYDVALTLSPGPNPAPSLELRAGSTQLAPLPLTPGARTYHVLLPRRSVVDGDIQLEVRVAPFSNPGDSRELGVALGEVGAEALGDGTRVPPLREALLLLAATGLAMLVAARSGVSRRATVAAGLALGGACIAGLALDTMWLSPLRATLPAALLGALVLLVVLDLALRRVWRALSWDPAGAAPLRLVVAAAFVVYLAGMLHPQMQMYDIVFHVNRFNDVWRSGQWFLTVGSSEWGGGRTFYPPLTYILAGPIALLTRDAALALVILMALLLAARLVLVYLLVAHGTGSARAGLWSSIVLAVLPVTVLPHQWGVVSNLLGETLTLAAATLIMLGWERLRRPAMFGALAATLALALLSHPGALILSAVLTLALIGTWYAARATRPQARTIGLAFVLACALAVGAYHWKAAGSMLPQAWAIVERQLGGAASTAAATPPGIACRRDTSNAPLKVQVGGSVSDGRLGLVQSCVHSWGEVASGGALGLWREAIAYFDLVPLLAAPVALVLLRRATAGPADAARQRRLGTLLAVWLLVALAFALVGVITNLYVRYPLFAAPALAAASTIVLDRLATNRWGRYAALVALLLLTAGGLAEWYARIMIANH